MLVGEYERTGMCTSMNLRFQSQPLMKILPRERVVQKTSIKEERLIRVQLKGK